MAKAKSTAATEEKQAAEKPEYGVPELAEELGIEPASVRVKLRNAGIEKQGRSYGWNSKKELQAVAKQLKTSDKAAAAEEVEEEAPAPTKRKGRGKKTAS